MNKRGEKAFRGESFCLKGAVESNRTPTVHVIKPKISAFRCRLNSKEVNEILIQRVKAVKKKITQKHRVFPGRVFTAVQDNPQTSLQQFTLEPLLTKEVDPTKTALIEV